MFFAAGTAGLIGDRMLLQQSRGLQLTVHSRQEPEDRQERGDKPVAKAMHRDKRAAEQANVNYAINRRRDGARLSRIHAGGGVAHGTHRTHGKLKEPYGALANVLFGDAILLVQTPINTLSSVALGCLPTMTFRSSAYRVAYRLRLKRVSE